MILTCNNRHRRSAIRTKPSGLWTLLILAFAGRCYADSPDSYLYFRHDNFDHQTPLHTEPVCVDKCDISGLCANTCSELIKQYPCDQYYTAGKPYAGWCDQTCHTCSKASEPDARRVDWESSFKLFDSPQRVHVTRFDLFNSSTDVNLGTLSLPDGAGYIFTTSPLLLIHDIVSNKTSSIYSESVAWISSGSCVSLQLGRGSVEGNASVVVVSSGVARMGDSSSSCTAGVSRIGYDQLHNNPVDYVPQGTCSDPLSGPGGASDYDDLDAPIGPLRAHYHTRGALYYNSKGTSNYDTGVQGLMAGELRFVQQGFFYGPETMSDDAYVMSFHEPDPSARSTNTSSPPSEFQPCAFACCDNPSDGAVTMKCIAPAHNR